MNRISLLLGRSFPLPWLVRRARSRRRLQWSIRTPWRAGELLVEPPTLINLGFEWFVEGDENRNATVAVSYRRSGESVWKQAPTAAAAEGRTRLQPVAG